MKNASITAAAMLAAWIAVSLTWLWVDLPPEIYFKLSISFALVAGPVFLIAMIRTEYVTGDMRLTSGVAVGMIALWTIISLAQLWAAVLTEGRYGKLTLTMLLIGGGCVAVTLLRRNYLTNKKLKKEGYID